MRAGRVRTGCAPLICYASDDDAKRPRWFLNTLLDVSYNDLRYHKAIEECALVVRQGVAKLTMDDGTRAQPFIQTPPPMHGIIEANLGLKRPVAKVETPARSRRDVHGG